VVLASNVQVSGNLVGTDATGLIPLGNTQDGVYLGPTANNTTLGGVGAAFGNLISANGGYGIRLDGVNAVIDWNLVGLNINGLPMNNAIDWLFVVDPTRNNTIGPNNQHQ
jgi:hypothetical protein